MDIYNIDLKEYEGRGKSGIVNWCIDLQLKVTLDVGVMWAGAFECRYRGWKFNASDFPRCYAY